MGGNTDEDADVIEIPMTVEMEEIPITGMIIKTGQSAEVKDNRIFNTIEGEGKKIHLEGVEDNGMEMTQITVTEITGIETPMVKVIQTGVEDGIIIIEVKDIVIMEGGRRWNPSQQYHDPGYPQQPQISKPNSLSSTTHGTSIQVFNPI